MMGVLLGILPLTLRTFQEVYAEAEQKAELTVCLEGRVELLEKGEEKEIKEGEFSFYLISENPEIQLEENERRTEAGGRINLGSYTVKKEGVYVFLVKQKPGNRRGSVYDLSEFRILLEVEEDKEGCLSYRKRIFQNGKEVEELVFSNTCQKEEEVLEVSFEEVGRPEKKGEIKCRGVVRNMGKGSAKDLRMRFYIPSYCSYLSHVGNGTYGVIEQKEQVTFYREVLESGEEEEFLITFRLHTCRPRDYQIRPVLWYGTNERPEEFYVNDPKNPAHRAEFDTWQEKQD
ncbi:hypothetical protein M2454_000964 [Aequitasia blattaphilus]|uniref:Streptococcal pilin isopeptide linkage domain-containing protein n=1 Tax=Aequitasia blattaphilus TaxID=2949332 RepID=A0ABT1E9D1_9FIRM|nr:FctA domain-containing protein [Aequitasia blattaphilus]MCP1102428.1 hypothetical protein [Aequitasia blattaphilus]MCR8615068.1 hypothetical protein [Aequitasia blattaphilus]